MKLSIVTINLNNKNGLQKTINSVVNQTYKDYQWIVIDGGSSDGSKDLLKVYDSKISLSISEKDGGIYNAMNKGIKECYGEYVLFLNSGDYLFDNHVLEGAIKYLSGKDFYVGYQKSQSGILRIGEVSNMENLVNIFIFGTGFPHGSTFIKKTTFEKFGLYSEEAILSSDGWHFYKALFLGGAEVGIIPFVITVFAPGGVSDGQTQMIHDEQSKFLSKYPLHQFLNNFYKENYEIVKALKSSQWFYNIFRVYFYFYRKRKLAPPF